MEQGQGGSRAAAGPPGTSRAASRGVQAAIVLVFVVLGLMLSVQFRVSRSLAEMLPVQRTDELVRRLQAIEKERDDLRGQVAQLRQSLAQGAQSAAALKAVEGQLREAQMLAGLVELRGQGLVVSLDDSKLPRRPGEDPNRFILHDEDLLKVVNELNDAGAEAIAVNGQRLTGTSEIRCAGSVISINNTRTAPPVEIVAIGDPDTLERALRLRGGVADQLAFFGIEIDMEKRASVAVPAYTGGTAFKYARPVVR